MNMGMISRSFKKIHSIVYSQQFWKIVSSIFGLIVLISGIICSLVTIDFTTITPVTKFGVYFFLFGLGFLYGMLCLRGWGNEK